MRRIDRTSVAVPACLASAPAAGAYPPKPPGLDQIRSALLYLQGYRCAYCERRTGDDGKRDGHIEHFREQALFPNLALDWGNLFWSCNDSRTCGQHKGYCCNSHGSTAKFDHANLVNPACDDPENFLLFLSDGRVQPRGGLAPAAHQRAVETIRVFNLNESAYLERSRQDAIRPYLRAVTSLASHGPAVLRHYVNSELVHTQTDPFSTAIKHFLTSVAP